MAIDWSKVFEVFGSGVIGVFTVMFLLMVLTQLTTKIIDLIENWNKVEQSGPESPVGAAKEKS
jgi:hypothetical protein